MKTYNAQDISSRIKAEAMRLGFSACGIAKAEAVDSATASAYRMWLAEGNHADMTYLDNNLDKRLDPTLLMPSAKSIVCLAMNYYPDTKLGSDQYQFAYYAYGQDYHDVMKSKMRELVSRVLSDNEVKLCVDTVPMMDRYWAQRAGVGWIGKNGNLIIPHAGSFFFLCEILVDIELEYDIPMSNHCGTCHKCIDSCPSGALCVPYIIDARKCLSYLTIEHRGDFTEAESQLVVSEKPSGNEYIYGCDRCQLACPYNNFATPTKIEEFTPKSEFLSMQPADWQQLTVEQYRSLFKGSAVKRAKFEGLLRNIKLLQPRCPQD